MSTQKDMDSATDTSSEILRAVLGLCDKMARIEQLVARPHIPQSTMATALFLTGTTSRAEIARLLGVAKETIRTGQAFESFRRAEGAVKSLASVSRRRKSGDDFIDDDD